MITKNEFLYLVYATLFSFILFGLALPYATNSGLIGKISPLFQFIIFNVGIFIFLQIFLSSTISGTKVKIIKAIGLLTLFIALDLYAPPFLVTTQGELLKDIPLGGSASDYAIGSLFQYLGVSGFLVYFLTYIIAPFILLLISALILKDISKNLPN